MMSTYSKLEVNLIELLTDLTHLVLVLERLDVAHELFERVLLLVEDEVLGEGAVQLLHLLGHRLQNITLRAGLLAERTHLLQESGSESTGWLTNGQLRSEKSLNLEWS